MPGVMCFLTFKILLAQNSHHPDRGFLATAWVPGALYKALCPSFLLAQMSPRITAWRCLHLLPLPGNTSVWEGGPTNLVLSAICTERPSVILLVTNSFQVWALDTYLAHLLTIRSWNVIRWFSPAWYLSQKILLSRNQVSSILMATKNSQELRAFICHGSFCFWFSLLPCSQHAIPTRISPILQKP